MTHGALSVWAAYDLPGDSFVDGFDFFGNPAADNLDTLASGIAVAFVVASSASAVSWTGLTLDGALTGTGTASGVTISAASRSKTTAGALAIQADQGANISLNAASYR